MQIESCPNFIIGQQIGEQAEEIEQISPNDPALSWDHSTECEMVYGSVQEAIEMYIEVTTSGLLKSRV